ncbi:MAG TPA: nitroreductase family deazaflavin-dependent oxidoreductase [Ktedonobacteraceae bacterium]|nr:nitroreductase family deazaflavin-dependent oxidoreductase [Ktedonobacteraceae bacterium]
MFIFKILVFLYNVSGGRIGGKMGQVPVLLLTTVGRKSGKQRTLPLVYIMDGPAYVITASAGGADKNPGWFFNIRSNPQATIQVKDKHIKVTAEVAEGEKKSELWSRLVEVAPNFAGYQKRTSREIPMVILHPVEERLSA